jgi:hypothetical protein
LHAISIIFCNCFTWAVSGRSCPSIKIQKAVQKFIIHAFIAPFVDGKPMAVSTPFSPGSVSRLHQANLLDTTIIHGDGTTTAAKKGGDNIGFSGHMKMKGDKIVAFCDRKCNVIALFFAAAGNRNESPLLREALPRVTRIAQAIGLDLQGTIVSLDGIYDCRKNRKAIFNRGMTPNINANPRSRKSPKRGRKPLFDAAIFKERFHTIERLFGWEDKFRRLLLRFERISQLHYAFKLLAYTMINLRHFCQG